MDATERNARQTAIENQIEQLGTLSRTDLVELWVRQFKCNPPKSVKRGLLERAAGYQLQAKRSGKLKPATQRVLIEIISGQEKANGASAKPSLACGSRLVREWHGQTHYVDVTDDGFEWNSERYTSLSAIACAITGAKWSGPRFFGVSS